MMAPNSSALKGNLKSLVATGGVLAGTGTASQAAIVFTDLVTDLTVAAPGGTIFFSLTGQAADTTGAVVEQFRLLFYDGYSTKPFIRAVADSGAIAGTTIFASRLGPNAPVNSSLAFAPTRYLAYTPSGEWDPGDRGYLGIRFNAGAGDRFAWADVSYNANSSLTLYGFAYEDSGGQILTPPVPEPATTGAIAAVLAGSVAAFEARRRRKAAKQAAQAVLQESA